jgi:alkylated DNA repair dioxygenase AlkB
MTTATTAILDIDRLIAERASQLDVDALRATYLDQDEFLVVDHFLDPEIIAEWGRQLASVQPHLHRSFIPKHKKSGSASYESVQAHAPAIAAVYHSPALLAFLRRITGAEMQECPPTDQHRCALYAYTEEGDHMGWHYDTSYYKDRRWTLLVGFQDNSSSRLIGKLHTRNPGHAVVDFSLQIAPGTLVLFNGDKVHHAVTPTRANEARYMVSMQFVTDGAMNPFMRFVSNMKDSIAYFGLRNVFGRRRQA